MPARVVELRRGILEKNDVLAAALRRRFVDAGTCAVNIVSGPGTGKTALLEVLLGRLVAAGRRPAALVGDCATENDARRLARSGAPVRQIVTGAMCHLEADMIEAHLEGWELEDIEFLFVENVGNLVCPSGFDLGEAARLVALSVTEGEDKPLKYPHLFNSSDLAVITKIDLADAVEFDRALAHANVREVAPAITIVETSARTGAGIDELITELAAFRRSLAGDADTQPITDP